MCAYRVVLVRTANPRVEEKIDVLVQQGLVLLVSRTEIL